LRALLNAASPQDFVASHRTVLRAAGRDESFDKRSPRQRRSASTPEARKRDISLLMTLMDVDLLFASASPAAEAAAAMLPAFLLFCSIRSGMRAGISAYRATVHSI
jgi:hypothetical protein